MKLIRKFITTRKLLNSLLRIPFGTQFTKLSNGLVTEVQSFKNKQIIKVKFDTESRFLRKI